MEHYLDIETKLFEKVKEHETTEIQIPRCIAGRKVKTGDTLKLYHPGDETEALRVEIIGVKEPVQEPAKELMKEPEQKSVQEMSEEPVQEPAENTPEGEAGDAGQMVTVSFSLLEWMCRLETELDELLRQEEMWMQGLL